MKYFLSSNLKVLRRNLATYLPTTLFLTAGMIVLFVIFCGAFSFFDDLHDRMKNVRGMDITIIHNWSRYHERPALGELFRPTQKNVYIPDEDSVLMPSDLALIAERLGDRVQFKAASLIRFSIKPEEEWYNFQVAFLSDDFFEPFHNQMEGDFIMGSRRLLEVTAAFSTLGSPYYGRLLQFPFIYDSQREVFTDLDGDGEIRMLCFEDAEGLDKFDLMPLISDRATGEAKEPCWEEYLFIPMKYYFDVYHPRDNAMMSLRASADDFDSLYELLALLNENHQGRMTYVFDETSSGFLRGIREQTEMAAVAVPVTLIFLFVVGMNFMGLQLMSIRRRQKDFAIQMACGARQVHLVSGALLLVLLTVTIAALLGAGLGAIIVDLLEVRLYNVFVTVKWISILPVLGLGWLIGGLSCLPTLVRLGRLSPVDILTNL